MTFLTIMGAIILTGLGVSIRFFRKGGIYNPIEKTPEHGDPTDGGTVFVPVEAPKVPPVPVVVDNAPKPTLTQFCTALRDFEGKPGDQNYRYNNPGNCRWNPGGYLPIYGNVRQATNGFAIFPTYELGWLYLKNMIKGQIHKRPDQTILEFFQRYAPPSDNNPTIRYSKFVAQKCGVDNTFKVGKLVLE